MLCLWGKVAARFGFFKGGSKGKIHATKLRLQCKASQWGILPYSGIQLKYLLSRLRVVFTGKIEQSWV